MHSSIEDDYCSHINQCDKTFEDWLSDFDDINCYVADDSEAVIVKKRRIM